MKKQQIQTLIDKLNKTMSELKKELYGMDSIIDQIGNLIKPWYAYGLNRDKPLVINLFGMTGTGKTELIKKLLKKLDIENIYIDARSFSDSSIKNIGDGTAVIIDELQHFRSIDERGFTIRGSNRSASDVDHYWRLLTGDIPYNLAAYFASLSYSILSNDNSSIKDDYKSIIKAMKRNYISRDYKFDSSISENEGVYFRLNKKMIQFLEKNEKELNGKSKNFILSTLKEEFIENNLENESNNNLLIFNLGNVDDIVLDLVMDLEFLSQNELNKKTSQVSPTDCRESLLKMFKPEEVSRFGENLLFMPSINFDSLKYVVNEKLKKIAEQYFEKIESKITFDYTVCDYLVDNYNIPAQGLRPILSSLNKIVLVSISSKIDFLYESKINIKICNEELIIEKNDEKEIVQLPSVKKEDINIDYLKRIALHESGHAVIYYKLFKKSPEVVSVTAKSKNIAGYIKKHEEQYTTKLSIENSICVALAGFLTEEISYGKDNVCTGSSSDIKNATIYSQRYINKFGFGEEIFYHNAENYDKVCATLEERNDNQITKLLQKCKNKTENLVKENIQIIEALSERLIKNPILKETDLDAFFKSKEE